MLRLDRLRRRWIAHAAIASLALVAGGGCPFDTRDAVAPDDPGDVPPECQYTSATQPGDVLRNLEAAFGCTDVGVDLLRQSLAPFFDFDAPDEDSSVQSFVDAWQGLVEPREGPVGQFTQHMGGLAEGVTAMLTLDAEDGDEVNAPEGDGFLFDNVAYELDFLDGANEIAHFEGEADILVRLEGTDYVAYQWIDIDTGFPTMARFFFGGTAAGE